MAREPHFVEKYSSYLGTAIKLVLYILKQLFYKECEASNPPGFVASSGRFASNQSARRSTEGNSPLEFAVLYWPIK